MRNLWFSFYSFSSLITIFANIINLLSHFVRQQNMGTEKINRLKIVLVEQGKTGKWLAGQLGKNEGSYCFPVVFQYEPTLIGDADEDSCHIECGCEKID